LYMEPHGLGKKSDYSDPERYQKPLVGLKTPKQDRQGFQGLIQYP
jgi:hypothetical protein